MRLMVGVRVIGGAIIIQKSGYFQSLFRVPVTLSVEFLNFRTRLSQWNRMLGNTCKIILEGLIGMITMMERRKEGHHVESMWDGFLLYAQSESFKKTNPVIGWSNRVS